MSRLFEALQKAGLPTGLEAESQPVAVAAPPDPPAPYCDLDSVPALRAAVCDPRLPAFTDTDSFAAEQFRVLSARLHQAQETRELKTVLVTSSMLREGKTMVSLNLAVTLARRARRRTLLVDFDLRRPSLCRSLGFAGLKGLGDWHKSGDESPTRFLYRIAELDFWLFPAGTLPAQPLELLQSERLPRMLAQLAGSFDWVIIDSAPLVPMADSGVLARMVDGVLLVVRQSWTSKTLLQKAMESLSRERLVGLVLNEAAALNRHQYEQYYYADREGSNGNGSVQKPMSPDLAPERELVESPQDVSPLSV